MPDLDLQTSYRQLQFWPPIHSALDVYIRRKAGGAEPYALIWRLIHVWECTTIMLASAAASRVRCMTESETSLDRTIRERLFGYSANEADGRLQKNGAGALDGSIDKWREILWMVAKGEPKSSGFLESLCLFLNSQRRIKPEDGGAEVIEVCSKQKINLDALITAWRKACDVPPNVLNSDQDINQTLQSINTFRNRFAHVPFPAHRLSELHVAFEIATDDFFRCAGGGQQSCLCGAIRSKNIRIQGNGPATDQCSTKPERDLFAWGHKNKKDSPPEQWVASPFVLLDEMTNVYLLTRLKDIAGSWEYTRYFSEGDTIRLVVSPALLGDLPPPKEEEYLIDLPRVESEETPEQPVQNEDFTSPVEQPAETPAPQQREPDSLSIQNPEPPSPPPTRRECRTYYDALDAISARDYAPAIECLERVVQERPNYHVAWQRLGYAQRERAVQLDQAGNSDDAIAMLSRSLASFKQSAKHNDREYQAEAHYQSSKSQYRLHLIQGSLSRWNDALNDALNEAETAARMSASSKFITWCEFLEASKPTGE